jgi:hypothetical protein
MSTQPLLKVLTLAAAIASFPGLASSATTIGASFLRGAGADVSGVQNSVANSLAPTDTAGAGIYAQANWNNLGASGTNITLMDSSGASSGVVINWTSSGTWSQAGGGTPSAQGSPDANLMNSYLDSNGSANTTFNANLWANSANNKPLVHFSGLSAWMASQGVSAYDIVLYSDGDDAGGRVGEFWTVDANSDPTALVLGSDQVTHVFICDRTNFTAALAYGPVPNIVQSGLAARFGNWAGDYTVIDSLTADSFLVRDAEFATRCVINAIQIIPRATANPATIAPLPSPQVFAGANVRLNAQVGGRTPQTFRWQKNGTDMADGGNIGGSGTASLVVSNVTALDAASYALKVTSPVGTITSAPAVLTIVGPISGSYVEKVVTNGPYAYWRFNDNVDTSSGYALAVDYAGWFHGTYGTLAQTPFNSIAGPSPGDWPGFESGNGAFLSTTNGRPSWVTAPPLNLNTNTATFCAWIYPYTAQNGFTALFGARNGNDVASFGYGANNNLGYTWNSNNAATYNFTYGSAGYAVPLQPPANQWSFVALAISPTNAILYLFNTNAQLSATNTIAHTAEGWSGLTFLGCDAQNSTGTPQGRSFNGIIDEMAVFNKTVSPLEIYNLYKKALGLNAIAPAIASQPAPKALFEGRKATFNVVASGDQPLTYFWRKNGVNMSNGGNVSGADTPSLTISNVTIVNDIASYDVVVQNIAGFATSIVATLNVVTSNNLPVPYEAKLRAANPIAYWRLNEANGSPYVYDNWGGFIATNLNATLGVVGPEPPDFTGLEGTNTAGSFDGLTSYIDTGVSLINNRGQFSILGWFNSAGTQGTRIGLFGQNDVAEFGFHGVGPSGFSQLGIWTPSAAAYLEQTNIIAGTWYLVACVATGTNVNLYLVSTNGGGGFQVVQSTSAGSTTNYGVSAFPFRMGGGGVLDPSGNFFTGLMDEVAVFDRALSGSELSDIFGAALTGGDLPPGIAIQPSPAAATLYAGRSISWTVSAVGTSPSYQWRKDGVPLSDSVNVSGSGTPTLSIGSVAGTNQGAYDVVITNHIGSITSSVVSLTVITPVPGSYEAATIAGNPFAYYRLNETNDPSGGALVAHDYVGGHDGLYGSSSQNGFNGILGPVPPLYIGFDASNTAMNTLLGTPNSFATAPVGSLSTNTVTFTAWLYPNGAQDAWSGLLVNRNAGAAGGFNYNDQQMLGYTWNNNNQNTWGFVSGLVIPSNQWSFVAVAISPTNATLYLINANGIQTANNPIAHNSDVFGNNWQIGHDNSSNNNNGSRNYNGIIDEVALYLRTLSASEILNLYNSGGDPIVDLTIQQAGPNVILSWPQGTLLQADQVTGPWTTNTATSPYTNTANQSQKFYKVIVR